MAITVQEALQLPIMQKTTLIAGHKGLAKEIKWVTIVEVLEDINRLQQGEFLITTGFGLVENQEKQDTFTKLLSIEKLSGVAIYKDFYLEEIPEAFIDAANKNNLPIIEIPSEINFSMITRAILEQIVYNQMQLLEYSLHVHKQLTKMVLENKDLNEITNTLSTLTSSTILITNEMKSMKLFVNQNKDLTVQNSSIVKIMEHELPIWNLLEDCERNKASLQRILHGYKIAVYPIIANNHFYGSIVSIKLSDTWNEMDDIAIEHASTVYAIELLKNEAVEETKLRFQGDFLEEEIIHGNGTNESLILSQGAKIGYDFSLPQVFYYLTFKHLQEEEKELQVLLKKLFQTLTELFNQKNKGFLVRSRLDSLMLLTSVSGQNDEERQKNSFAIAEEIVKQWNYFFSDHPIIIGIGKCYEDMTKLYKSASEAKLAITLSNLITPTDSIIHFNDLGMYELLINMKDSGINLEAFYKDNIGKLIEQSKQGLDLLETLDVYLKNNQNMTTTASELFIHRHTLKYRLEQIEAKTGLQFQSADKRMQIHLAIKAYKLLTHLEKDVRT
ncbi:purine catabolism regulator [Salirhabdus euzebyi]|uniref:Purine catabolism regulator n=1 Tax=Salirhabdus euzebyi TaxID=394506 RepID=A0A841Q4P8_9BACI|nr:PucR family transcriptional regulator [Salirhabdus euzebyi]MBB6453368.1 purine catabolism regulator [Salirhabdus euzebyi]